MQRPTTIITPLKKSPTLQSSASNTQIKKIRVPPLDSNSKASPSSSYPHTAVKSPRSQLVQGVSGPTPIQHGEQAKSSRAILHKQAYSGGRSTVASSSASYITNSYLSVDNKNRSRQELSKALHSRQQSQLSPQSTSTAVIKQTATSAVPKSAPKGQKTLMKSPSSKTRLVATQVQKTSQQNFEQNKENISPLLLSKDLPPSTIKEPTSSLPSAKREPKPVKKLVPSFQQSFAESENFNNIDEKQEDDLLRKCPNVKCVPLSQLIKERFLGPIMAEHGGNTGSFMKRNVLLTSSNYSNMSSNSSFKSSFLVKVQTDHASLASPCTENMKTMGETDEQITTHASTLCQKVANYNLAPKTIYNELAVGASRAPRVQQLKPQPQQPPKMSDFVTSVPLQYAPLPQEKSQHYNLDSDENEYDDEIDELDEAQDSSTEQHSQPNEHAAQEDIVEFLQSDTHKMHLIQTLQSLQYVKNSLLPAPREQLLQKKVLLPPFRKPWITKTIIFDLDETLVHCVEDIYNNKVDHIITVQFPNQQSATAGINVRPYAIECLKRAAQMFQVVVFTASHQSYADVVLNLLDPFNEIFDYRLYRDSCVRSSDGVYVKDLRIFESNRSLKDIVIVDNAVYSFGYQLENGIPIIPFYHDKEDEELLHLTQYLECLARNGGDVREHNSKAFQLKELQELDVQQFLSNMLYESNQKRETAVNRNQVHIKESAIQKQTSQSHISWDAMHLDSEVINEESGEEDDSAAHDPKYYQNRRRRVRTSKLISKQERELNESGHCLQVVTNTSILEKDMNY